ncbi:regulator of telomere elongation helicase 1 homolog [Glycine soja]|uniref:Regulator of telomere elongation helicase 1 homolog n=1 Tax=Glycine soja TaxID=3848 RepID=A0A445IFN1_GLYSO|nr:regulator of telomere elongation helicase 1 homolog [Glycine soja]KHN32605.1 Regulator of telomere elongation helicase 1 [Glycine soja]RZB84647.1 Regulator of telomere elongation helicase 1-like isoform A [Glycine soja]RZB84648.1 Regulator of telomere elongation helicase 1-like isoform B [Glycine soja]
MPTYKIRGIDVDFPYEAYESQLVYMDKVIQSLQEKCNALLESPTGTGKTLCLLCATLAWRKSLGSFTTGVSMQADDKSEGKNDVSSSQSESSRFSTIVYASRTHSQIRQVIQELKRTSYRPKMVVLGSREQLCIHDEVKLLRGKTQTNACRLLCRRRGKRHCNHFKKVPEYMKDNPQLGEEPVDIEDLVNIGRRFGPCPYYLSKELHKFVDIVFAPYNYLIDRGYRKSLQLSWSNSILIFDEAHNLESICADAASFDLPSWLLTACISEAESCIDLSIERRDKSNDKSQNPDDFAILRALLLKLEKRIAEVPIESKELGYTKPGPYLYELLADLNITHKTASKLRDIVAVASTLLEEHNQQKSTGTVCRLDRIGEILDMVFRDGRTAHAKYYRVHLREVEAWSGNGSKGKVSRTLSWWCFNPGIAMEDFPKYGVRSIILTSGTLSPMESFAQELKLDFPIRLENPHVITANQIWAGVLPVGPSGRTFNSSYRTRDSPEYKQELGNAIVNLARIVPDGLLVFFPSYYLLDQIIACWKSSNENSTSIWDRICKHKKPVIEPRDSSSFPLSIKDYMTTLNDTSASGAIFFAVCRGKVSEGLDFADHAGRAVVITGLPFATSTDPKVRLKREYLDQQSRPQGELFKVLTGDEWYNQQASRAVNQAVGRVIRHRYDYGAIIFCDERFSHPHRQSQVSRWIQPHIKCFSRFGEVVFTLTRFFRDVGTQGPTKVSMLEAKNGGNIGEILSSDQNMDKFHKEKLLSHLATPMTQNFSASSLLDTKKGCTSFLGEIVPANRSSLFSDNGKTVHCESSRNICGRVLLGERKTLQSQECDRLDLADDCQLGEKSKDTPIAPCSSKKRRFITGDYDLKQYFGNSNEHSSSASQSAQGGVDLRHKDGVASDSLELIRQKGNLPDDFVPSVGDETKGSAFLAQVRDKLSAAEYINFVGYMKALKTKTMKISEVLQCISRLFTGPDRLPLLKRFKDYIPAKYHSLYEHYVEKK